MKLIMVDGLPHRMRRGKLVAIPLKWFNVVTTRQTIRKRKKQAKHNKSRRVGANIKGSGY